MPQDKSSIDARQSTDVPHQAPTHEPAEGSGENEAKEGGHA